MDMITMNSSFIKYPGRKVLILICIFLIISNLPSCYFNDGYEKTEDTGILIQSDIESIYWIDESHFVFKGIDLSSKGKSKKPFSYVGIYDIESKKITDNWHDEDGNEILNFCVKNEEVLMSVGKGGVHSSEIKMLTVANNKFGSILNGKEKYLFYMNGQCYSATRNKNKPIVILAKHGGYLKVERDGFRYNYYKGNIKTVTSIDSRYISDVHYDPSKKAYFVELSKWALSQDKNYGRPSGWLYEDGRFERLFYPKGWEMISRTIPVRSGLLLIGEDLSKKQRTANDYGIFLHKKDEYSPKILIKGQVKQVGISKSGCRLAFAHKKDITEEPSSIFKIRLMELCDI